MLVFLGNSFFKETKDVCIGIYQEVLFYLGYSKERLAARHKESVHWELPYEVLFTLGDSILWSKDLVWETKDVNNYLGYYIQPFQEE